MIRVLYVDDEPDIREIVSIALSLDPDIVVETAPSGRDAIERLRCGGIDLVLLDVMMPGMDGPTTLAHLRSDAATRDLKVVFVTARTQRHEVDQYISLGALGVVHKPFDPMSLAREICKFSVPVAA